MPEPLALRRTRPLAPPAIDGFSLEFAPPAARFILRGDVACAKAAGEAFGVPLPTTPCRAAQSDDRTAIWLGPDEWLLIATSEEPETTGAIFASALADRLYSLVDVSHRQRGLILRGRKSARALSAGCPLDLRPDAFPPTMAARTIFAKSEIVLWRQTDEGFHVEVWRSFCDYVVALLYESARGAPTF